MDLIYVCFIYLYIYYTTGMPCLNISAYIWIWFDPEFIFSSGSHELLQKPYSSLRRLLYGRAVRLQQTDTASEFAIVKTYNIQQISMQFLEYFFAEFISWTCDQVPLFSSHAVTKGPVLMLIHNESDTTSAEINQEAIIFFYRCAVHSDVCRVHSPIIALLLI